MLLTIMKNQKSLLLCNWSIQNPINNEIVTNLTTGKVGPIAVPPGEAIKFDQKLMLI